MRARVGSAASSAGGKVVLLDPGAFSLSIVIASGGHNPISS